ncbi:MAG: ADP-ribosylglycohydrolase family protein [Caldilineaceae bacterium]
MESVLDAAVRYLKPISGAEVRTLIEDALALAQSTGDYEAFRAAYHERFRRPIACDTRETVPATMALCYLAKGDPREAIIYGANFGRDTDTIATMAGAICGALTGIAGLPAAWVAKIAQNSFGDQQRLAGTLIDVAMRKARAEGAAWGWVLQ